MQQDNTSNQRNNRINSIRQSLKVNPILTKNTLHIKKMLSAHETYEENDQKNQKAGEQQQTPFQKQYLCEMSQFEEKYQLLQKIGEGANGVVKKCLHKTKGEIFAVKSMNIDEQHIYFLKENFLQIKKLNHQNIVSYKSLYIDRKKNLCNLVMEYINWPNLLYTTIQSESRLKKIIYQLFQVIQYIHKNLICHRDIKPQNILYNYQTQQIKIIDFGISKKLTSRNFNRQMMTPTGTFFYKAPQIFLGGGYNQKIDQWAAAVTLYKLITKVTPFQSEYHSQTIENILKGEIQFNDKTWESYSPFVQDLLKRIFKPQKNRLSAQDACKHHWFTSSSSLILFRQVELSRSMTCEFKNPLLQNGSWEFQEVRMVRLNSVINEDCLKQGKWIDDGNKDFIDSDSDCHSEEEGKTIQKQKLKK